MVPALLATSVHLAPLLQRFFLVRMGRIPLPHNCTAEHSVLPAQSDTFVLLDQKLLCHVLPGLTVQTKILKHQDQDPAAALLHAFFVQQGSLV